jgi:RNA-directed DNA polymerase
MGDQRPSQRGIGHECSLNGLPTLRDRIVQGALLHELEPISKCDFALQSYGLRPGKGCKDALHQVD